MNRYVIETKQITKTYNPRSPFIALDHVDLHVSEGCIYGLIGDNGAGKSTLLKLLAGHIFPTNGELCLFGETEEKALCNIRKNIGCLIEYPCFVPGMTVEQTLHYYAIQKGVPDNKKIGEQPWCKHAALQDANTSHPSGSPVPMNVVYHIRRHFSRGVTANGQ